MNYAILFDADNKEVPVRNEIEYREKLLNGHTIAPLVIDNEEFNLLKEEAKSLGISFGDNITIKGLSKKIEKFKKDNTNDDTDKNEEEEEEKEEKKEEEEEEE